MQSDNDQKTVWSGRHLDVAKRGRWEYVTRKNSTGVVGIVAVTDGGAMVLVEQLRLPPNARVIELPAGLAGDIPGEEEEALEAAARRELLEETGYEATEIVPLTYGLSSAGLTDETIHLLLARGLRKVAPGGGDESEDIVVHEIPVAQVHNWLQERMSHGTMIDLKIYAGLYFLSAPPRYD